MIVVTGSTGRIGQAIQYVDDVENACDCLFMSRDPKDHTGPKWYKWDASAPIATLLPAQTTSVLHLAGATPSKGEVPSKQSFLDANCALTLKVLEAAKARSAARVLIASSASVYGRPSPAYISVSEEAPLSPLNDYAQSKVEMERQVATWCAANPDGPEVCIVRLGNIAGADQLLQNALVSTAAAPLRLDQFASGRGPLRSYIGPLTLARVLLGLCQFTHSLPACLNVTQGPPLHMDDLLTALGHMQDIFWEFKAASDQTIETLELNIDRLTQISSSMTVRSKVDEMIEEMFQLDIWNKQR